MTIKKHLYEKAKNNKAAGKLKKLTVAVLVAGTILTVACLTACEKTPAQSETTNATTSEIVMLENPYEKIEEKLRESKESFELDKVCFFNMKGEYFRMYCMDCYDYQFTYTGEQEQRITFGYDITQEQFNEMLNYFEDYQDDSNLRKVVQDYGDFFDIYLYISKEALKDEKHSVMASRIFSMVNSLEPQIYDNTASDEVVLENPYEKIEEKLRESRAGFELDEVLLVKYAGDDPHMDCMDYYDDKFDSFGYPEIKTIFTCDIPQEIFNEMLNYFEDNQDDSNLRKIVNEYDGESHIYLYISKEALKDEKHSIMVSKIFYMVNSLKQLIADYTESEQ